MTSDIVLVLDHVDALFERVREGTRSHRPAPIDDSTESTLQQTVRVNTQIITTVSIVPYPYHFLAMSCQRNWQ